MQKKMSAEEFMNETMEWSYLTPLLTVKDDLTPPLTVNDDEHDDTWRDVMMTSTLVVDLMFDLMTWYL